MTISSSEYQSQQLQYNPYAAELFELVLAPLRWQTLHYALTIQLFDKVESYETFTSLSQQVAIDAEPLLLLLNALCSQNYLTKVEQCFYITEHYKPYLLSNSQHCMAAMLCNMAQMRHCNDQQFQDLLQGMQLENRNFHSPQHWKNSQAALKAFHLSMAVPCIEQILYQLPNWQTINKWLDLGAGSVCLAKTVQAQYQNKQAVIFDLPRCAQAIEQEITQQNLQNIQVIAGDYNYDSIGAGYDLIWSSMSLYFAEDIDLLLAKISQALNKSGLFVSFHEGLQSARSQPQHHVLGRLIPSLNGNDLSFNLGNIAQACLNQGLSLVSKSLIETSYGQMELIVCQKTEP